MVAIKICGLNAAAALDAALSSGANYVGFVHCPASPRHITLEQGRALAAQARGRAQIVALTVDAPEPEIQAVVAAWAPDLLQLHGRETPEQTARIKMRTGLPVMKAFGISQEADLAGIEAYRRVADWILLDAKAPKGAAYPGGHGAVFDWSLLARFDRSLPLMLSGGLKPDNVAQAIAIGKPHAVDVSSGVEDRPGVKNPDRIKAFIDAARRA